MSLSPFYMRDIYKQLARMSRMVERELMPSFFERSLRSNKFFDHDPFIPFSSRNMLGSQLMKEFSWNKTDTVKNDEKEFKISMNVNKFSPEEIKVKTIENNVIIEGKHEDKENGNISREFSYLFTVPDECDVNQITSKLENGVLTVAAPKIEIEGPKEKVIPIERVTAGADKKTDEEKK